VPRSYREPEYRRRIREKTEKDQDKTKYKRHGTTEGSNIHEIVSAIEAIDKKYDRESNKQNARHKWDRLWEVLGVVGLWVAAAVGVAAIWYGASDSEKNRIVMADQLLAMGGQLNEMRISRKTTHEDNAAALDELTKQANAATAQAREAENQAAIAQRGLVASTRPWVKPQELKIHFVQIGIGDDKRMIVVNVDYPVPISDTLLLTRYG
jgi:hypothetical protein